MKPLSNNPFVKVSVAMCTYNGEAFISDQINSIIGQTYPIYELLIFDDASSDNTVKTIKEMAERFDCIKITVNKKNIGFTKNFEQAIQAASGDVIAISDQDDIWIDKKIEKMLAAWKPSFPVIYCNSVIFSNKPPINPEKPVFRQFEGTDPRKIFLFNTMSGHAAIIKKEFVKLIVPFTEGVMYDWWIAVVAAYNGGVQHYDEVLVFHRSHARNITVNSMSKYNEAEQRYLNKKILIKHSEKFANAPNIPASHKKFLIEYSKCLQESLTVRFHKKLFWLIFKNRHFFFNYKKRKFGIISHLKHSYLKTLTQFNKMNMEKLLFKEEP